MANRLKDSTIFSALSVLSQFDTRVKAVDFAFSYWSDKEMNGVKASIVGRNLLFKLRKYGYVTAFRRNSSGYGFFVFSVSNDGFKFLSEYQAKNGGG